MREKIIDNIDNSAELEKLYRGDKKGFESAFFEIYPEILGNEIAEFWKNRLAFKIKKEKSVIIGKMDILFLAVASAITVFLVQTPNFFSIGNEDHFYMKNAGMIVLFGLSLYAFLIKDKLKIKHALITIFVFIVSAVYINLLPLDQESDSVILALIHLPLMIWCLYGLIFIDFDTADHIKRVEYIKYNGDLAVLLALISIAGGILTGVTIGLFSSIDINIEQFYFEYIVICGAVSAPIVATYIIREFPFVVNKIAPLIASIFAPLVLITLVIYLVSILFTGKDPYNDRDFLIMLNLMLLGVMAIIIFSISEISINRRHRFSQITLLALSIVAFLIDIIALSAIIYRLGEFGFTPNRIAVLGSNILILVNLALIVIDLYRVNFKNGGIKKVELTIARYLPVYFIWTIFVVFALPLIFCYE